MIFFENIFSKLELFDACVAIIKHEFTKSDDDGDEEGSLTASATKTPRI